MNPAPAFNPGVLKLDAESAVTQVTEEIRKIVLSDLRRKGVVVGMSGGIDSSTVAALCVRALGPDRVLGLAMPESESASESLQLAHSVADTLRMRIVTENIAGILEAAGCYRRRDEAIRSVLPEYTAGYRSKIVLSNVVQGAAYPVFSVVVQSPEGVQSEARLTLDAYLGIVAATNFKQRTRKMLEYYYADRYNFAVAGTPNRLEYDQGFFVKNGDGAADIKPIAHLYKSQVYQLAEHLGVPEDVRKRPPTTDTYSLEQSQEEFYFSLPYQLMDLCLYAKNQGVPPAAVAEGTGLSVEQVERAHKMIEAKRRVAHYLNAPARLAGSLD